MIHDSATATSAHPYDALTPDTILDAMEEAGFAVSGRLFALNSYENRVYQVGLDEGAPVIAKFYRPGRWTEAAIREEHAITLEYLEADIPVVAPLVMPSGDTLGQHGEFLFAVFPQRGGQAPDVSVTDTLYRLGQWLGQMHNVKRPDPGQHTACPAHLQIGPPHLRPAPPHSDAADSWLDAFKTLLAQFLRERAVQSGRDNKEDVELGCLNHDLA